MPTYGRDASSAILMRAQADFTTQAAADDAGFIRLPAYEYLPEATREVVEDKVLGDGREPGEALLGFENWRGAVTVPMRSETFGWHLLNFFGSPPTTTGSGAFTHVFNLASAMRHVTFGRQAGAVHFADVGVTYNEMRLRVARAAEAQRVTFGLIGCREAKLGATLDANPVLPTNDRKMLAFRGALQLGGSAVGEIVDLDFQAAHGRALDEEAISGETYAIRVLEGDFSVTGTARFRFEDAALYDAAVAATERDMRLEWTDGVHTVRLDVVNTIFEKASVPLAGGGVITMTQRFRAAKPGVGERSLRATIINARANYTAPA